MKKFTITTHDEPAWRVRSDFIAFKSVNGDSSWREQLWCKKVDESTVEICCIPLAAYDISLGDIARIEHRDDTILITDVVVRSSWYSYRVKLNGPAETFLIEIVGMKVLHEPGKGGFIALAADGEEEARRLVELLAKCESAGQIEWEASASQ